ncbi:hypothetical protein [Rhodococcoides yunnanense]|uniref:Uncharacterized protein n=1 Tax=Rhodococcoides yunnanense TaxID=278209 RepID=A0ABU4BEA7_9NOCA|nr:hypothetical protein [Rhodococcus yunnanensis]MDV6262542.1 hypothetical protein [Rhodococcus yunnanensis]
MQRVLELDRLLVQWTVEVTELVVHSLVLVADVRVLATWTAPTVRAAADLAHLHGQLVGLWVRDWGHARFSHVTDLSTSP